MEECHHTASAHMIAHCVVCPNSRSFVRPDWNSAFLGVTVARVMFARLAGRCLVEQLTSRHPTIGHCRDDRVDVKEASDTEESGWSIGHGGGRVTVARAQGTTRTSTASVFNK